MAKQPKRIKAWTGDRAAVHSVDDAVKLVKANATAKFDESIEIAVNLGVDPRHAADLLVCVTRIDAQVDGDLDRFVELGGGVGLHRGDGLGERHRHGHVAGASLEALGLLGHVLSPPRR